MEFIPAYNELFKYLDEKGGKGAVVKFWESLSDAFLGNLRDLAASKGLKGCFEYWSRTLTEEAADFRMTLAPAPAAGTGLDEEKGVFEIQMRRCPSMGRLIDAEHIEPYKYYCEHCNVLYRRVLEPLGFKCDFDMTRCGEAKCKLTVTKK